MLATDIDTLDVSTATAVRAAVEAFRPDLVLHGGAYTAVDACESDPDTAFAVNALGTRHVAEAAAAAGAHLVYVSTDYVFDGTLDRPYVEWDAARSPLGLRAEQARRRAGGPRRGRALGHHRAHRVGQRSPRRQHGQDRAPAGVGRRPTAPSASSTTSTAAPPSPPTWPAPWSGWRSTAARARSTSPTRGRRPGSGSPRPRWPPPGSTPAGSSPSPPPISTRPARRPGRQLAARQRRPAAVGPAALLPAWTDALDRLVACSWPRLTGPVPIRGRDRAPPPDAPGTVGRAVTSAGPRGQVRSRPGENGSTGQCGRRGRSPGRDRGVRGTDHRRCPMGSSQIAGK